MRSFDGLRVEVKNARFRVGAYGGITRVGKRARLTITQSCNIMLIAAEVLLFSGSGELGYVSNFFVGVL